jgi:hypothetical protein
MAFLNTRMSAPPPLGATRRICFNEAMQARSPANNPRPLRPAWRVLAPVAALLLVALTTACSDGSGAAAQQWLHGAWELTFNPDQDSEDDLVFAKDGSMRVHAANARVIDGKYLVSGNELLMLLVVNGKPVEVRFEISPDKSRLIYKNGAYYTKKPRP